MTRPRLSVIIPFHDETAFVRMAVQSVLAQGLAGVEVVVVNDNPAMFDAGAIAALGVPASVQVVQHDRNRGLSAARNSGIAASTGARIGFLDADDYYLADGLAAQLKLAESSGADITHGGACLSAVGSPALRVLPRDRDLFGAPARGPGLRGVEAAQFITSSWSSLYRRDFLEGAGLRFDDEQVKFEDRLFVLQAVTAAGSISVLGAPVRVWRRRAGSISVTPPDAAVHLLQVQLLEKCMAVMRAHAAQPGTPPRFLKREVFNTVSRLIWDMGVVAGAAAGDAACAALMPRIAALLGDDSFGPQIFDDAVLRQISRVGVRSRLGVVRRVDFLAVHRALRAGDAAAAMGALAPKAAAPARVRRGNGASLVLHLGMHKTGSTFLQRGLLARRADLHGAGVLFPQAGLADADWRAVRPGGFPGHLGLLAALRRGDDGPWLRLASEIAASGCRRVILSCENMLMPVSSDREEITARLFERLADFAQVRLVAFVRRPDEGPEMLYRELACNGQRAGARSVDEFMVDYGAALTDLPGLFGPWERFAGAPVALVDHDLAAAAGTHWARLMAAAGLERRLGHIAPPDTGLSYPSPDRDQVAAVRLANTLMPDEAHRMVVLRAFFAAGPPQGGRASMLSPVARLALVEQFAAQSADFARARGYAPDLEALRAGLRAEAWQAPQALPIDLVERLQMARLQAEARVTLEGAPAERFPQAEVAVARGPGEIVLRLRPRPWLRRVLSWVERRWRR